VRCYYMGCVMPLLYGVGAGHSPAGPTVWMALISLRQIARFALPAVS